MHRRMRADGEDRGRQLRCQAENRGCRYKRKLHRQSSHRGEKTAGIIHTSSGGQRCAGMGERNGEDPDFAEGRGERTAMRCGRPSRWPYRRRRLAVDRSCREENAERFSAEDRRATLKMRGDESVPWSPVKGEK